MPDEDGLIAAHYRILPSRSAPTLQGGLRAFVVADRRDPGQELLAVETRPDLPARPRMPAARSGGSIAGTVLPIEYGPGRDPAGKPGWFVVAESLPGPAIGIPARPWRESELMALVLQPAATCLVALQAGGIPHRAINPANLFRARSTDPVTLGPFWAAPPASLQPSVYEPPYMARCLPTARGEGTVADDVYALGVTLLVLALGQVPMAELDETAILRRKIELGSFAALTAGAVLPPTLADLLRGMLAEDPEHRPSAALLLRPEQARARRVAARPARKARQPLMLADQPVWTARELALALGLAPERGHALLRSGAVEAWLRRCLGDPQLGMRVEETTRRAAEAGPDDVRAQALLLMRGIATIDPLAPLIWRGLAMQPDGMGCALVGAKQEIVAAVEEIVLCDAVGTFRECGRPQLAHAAIREQQKDWRGWLQARGPAGGVRRLTYEANPMTACASTLLGGQPVMRAAELLPALDAAATAADRTRPPIDQHVAAFLAARVDNALAGELAALTSFAGEGGHLAVLRLFAELQTRFHPAALPGLAGWLVDCGFASARDWRSHRTRADLQDKIAKAALAGQIGAILRLLDDEPARQADRDGAHAASSRVVELEAALRDIADRRSHRTKAAELLGHEIVAGAGLIASLGAAVALALP